MSSKQFCLKWNNFQSNILHAFESLQNTEDLTDVTLTCEGINLKAHKFILSACSPYFRTVFKENPCSHPIIILKDVQYQDLFAIINFMYHGEVLVSEEQLGSFLQTGKLLQVSGLNNTNDNFSSALPQTRKVAKKVTKYPKEVDVLPPPQKKNKTFPKGRSITSKLPSNSDNKSPTPPPKIAQDIAESPCDEHVRVHPEITERSESSILEAALEKPESILERSLTIAGKSPLLPMFASEPIEIPPRKPPDNLDLTSKKSLSPHPPTDFLQQTIKIEEETSYDSQENFIEEEEMKEGHISMATCKETVQPHHSSQGGNCPHCGKVYSNQSALKYHVRLVHSDLTNMYCCHLCPEAFSYREGYKKHMVEMHFIRN